MTPEKIISMMQDRGIKDVISFYSTKKELWSRVLESVGYVDKEVEEGLAGLMDVYIDLEHCRKYWKEITEDYERPSG